MTINKLAHIDHIDHIVVLMMENRSFDHMLGYLSLEGGRGDIDGLRSEHVNLHAGKAYPIHHLQHTALHPGQDPGHTGASVARQLQDHNGGFVSDYALTHPGDPDPGLVMGYYNGDDLPMHDFLARQFCVCDRCHSSVPGATWPNRLYAVSGRAAGSKDSKRVPLYANKSFVRQLERNMVSWKFYSFWKPWTLALTDEHYRSSEFYEPFGDPARRYGFVGDALAGTLPSVSWIDPHFFVNDDHPPADVRAGQALLAQVYQALSRGPAWERTLLIISYDEHGGFFDHVPPPAAVDDDAAFRQYGVRVPMLLVSPLVSAGSVCHQLFDHTSILKTILQRFCRGSDGALPAMGARVAAAEGLGVALDLARPRPAPRLPASVHEQRARLDAERRARADAAADADTAAAAEVAMPDEEAGVIAAHRYLARSTRNALAVHGKKAPQSMTRRRRKDGYADGHDGKRAMSDGTGAGGRLREG